MGDHAPAVRVLRESLRTALTCPNKASVGVQPSPAKWEAAGISFDHYRGLGDRRILLDNLVACHDVDPQDAYFEVATLPADEAAVRHRMVLAEIGAQRPRRAKQRRLSSAA